MNTLFRAVCLFVFALGLAGLAGLLPAGLAGPAQAVAAVLLLAHALEVPIFFKHVRKYRGPLALSVLLTLLFGLLHWKPLADAANLAARGKAP